MVCGIQAQSKARRAVDSEDKNDGVKGKILQWPLARGPLRVRRQPALALPAIAAGALAIGALAIGALAIGSLAIGRLAIGRTRVQKMEIGDLTVGRLRVLERDD
jgi:hypothetical protein